jgi:hypothetical protein
VEAGKQRIASAQNDGSESAAGNRLPRVFDTDLPGRTVEGSA